MSLSRLQLAKSAAVLLAIAFNGAHAAGSLNRSQVAVSRFGYEGPNGPLNWYGLNETTNLECDVGKHQSPINLNSSIATVPGSSLNIDILDYPEGAEFENLGTTIEVIVNGSLRDSGTNYSLFQFHFHTPSEHRIDREYFPLEAHFVFQSTDKQYAVIGVLIDICEGKHCAEPVFKAILSSVEEVALPGNVTDTKPLYFDGLLGKLRKSNFWRYTGSLTTPPCSENVDWLVSQTPLYIDIRTWKAVRKIVKYNSRYTQDAPGGMNLLQLAAEELARSGHL